MNKSGLNITVYYDITVYPLKEKKDTIIVVCNSLIIINSIHVIVMLLLFNNISLLNSCFLLSNYQLNVLGQSEWFSSNICKIIQLVAL